MKKSFKPRKQLGQHFLVDDRVIHQIVNAIHLQQGDQVVEIGPGFGALTTAVLPLVQSMSVVEYDREVIPYLKAACEKLGELHIYHEDILKFDLHALFKSSQKLRVIGNLPYNISTPLIFHLLSFCAQSMLKDMYFMVQNEVADRLAAIIGSKDYGRLTVMVQYYCRVEKLFSVPKEAFNPPPKVLSAVIRLAPYEKPPYSAKDFKLFETIVREAFSHRRKTLRNALRAIVPETLFQQLRIDPRKRPEQLSLEDFVAIANAASENV